MVTITEVKTGLNRYLESELLNKISGWQKWIVAAALSRAMENSNAIFDTLSHNEMVKALNVINDEGMIDVETIYHYVLPEAQKGPAIISIPLLGDVTIRADDVEKLYHCIMS